MGGPESKTTEATLQIHAAKLRTEVQLLSCFLSCFLNVFESISYDFLVGLLFLEVCFETALS